MKLPSILLLIAATALGQGTPDTFLRLRDTPSSYSGQGGKFVKVNVAANGLEFAAGGGGSFSGLYTDLDFTASNLTSIATRNFSDLQGKPTTISGYGITDGVTTARTVNSHALSANVTVTAADVGAPSGSGTSSGTNTGDQVVPVNTTGTGSQWFSAYNSTTGAFTKSQPTFTDLSAHPTTIAGYGITDFNSLGDARWQPLDADLTSWALITRASGFDTFTATPSSANLRAALTDENGTGAALFSGATTPDFTTGFTIGAAAASGKIPIGNGTNYVPSTPTYPNASGAAGYDVHSDGTNFVSYPTGLRNSSVANQSFTTSDTYVTGSDITVTAGDFKAKGQYRCVISGAKTAGTGAIVISVRVGTAGTTSDAAILTFTFGSGTSVSDTATFVIVTTFRTVGSGTSAVMEGVCQGQHNLATTGFFNNAAAFTIINGPSSGFNSSTATKIGVSVNGSTAFAGTVNLVQSTLDQT